MNIKINEKWREVKENCTVYSLKNKEFPSFKWISTCRR